MKLRVLDLLLLFMIVVSIQSCIVPRRTIYLHRGELDQVQDTTTIWLHRGDRLFIEARSLNEQTDRLFQDDHLPYGDAYLYLKSYIIDDSGFVNLPLIGNIHVEGKTLGDARNIIELALRQHYVEAIVNVRLTDFRISVLGEVRRPGTFQLYTNKITLLEALGQAGDLTDRGNRKKVKVVRTQNGVSSSTYLDLTDPEIISSPFFMLKPNDVIYIRPVNYKYLEENMTVWRTLVLSVTAFVTIYRLTR